jgi:hypothetical protein
VAVEPDQANGAETLSNLYINPKTRETLDPSEVTVRRIGGRQFYVETATRQIVLPSSTPATTATPMAPSVASTTGAQLEAVPGLPGTAPVQGKKRFRVAGETRIDEYQGSIYTLLLSSFKYPFKGYGIFLMLFGIGVFAALDWGPWYSIIVAVGYSLAYISKMISHTRNVEDGVPDFPSVLDYIDDIIRPIILVGFTMGIAVIPLILYTLIWLVLNLHHPTALYLVIGACLIYLPMGMMTACVLDSISGINPAKVFRAIFLAGPSYLPPFIVTCAFFMLRYFSIDLAQAIGNIVIGFCVVSILSFYLLAVQARMLGLIYHHFEKRLGWTNYGSPS